MKSLRPRCESCGDWLVISPGTNSEKVCLNHRCPGRLRADRLLLAGLWLAIAALCLAAYFDR